MSSLRGPRLLLAATLSCWLGPELGCAGQHAGTEPSEGLANRSATPARSLRSKLRDASAPFKASGTEHESWYRCADYCPLRPGQKNIVEFRCLNGACVSIGLHCNGFPNCADGSDEDNCPQTTPKPYDCSKDADNWGKAWSVDKKAWCCQHKKIGCLPKNAQPHDCQSERERWEEAWSDDKKQWCCALLGLGCVPAAAHPAAAPATTTAARAAARAAALPEATTTFTTVALPATTLPATTLPATTTLTTSTLPATTLPATTLPVTTLTATTLTATTFTATTHTTTSTHTATRTTQTATRTTQTATTVTATTVTTTVSTLTVTGTATTTSRTTATATTATLTATTITGTTTGTTTTMTSTTSSTSLTSATATTVTATTTTTRTTTTGTTTTTTTRSSTTTTTTLTTTTSSSSTTTTETRTSTTTTTTTEAPVELTMSCAEKATNYNPLDMFGAMPKQVANVAECQARCASVHGCAHYSYWVPQRLCHFQDARAIRSSVASPDFIAGPPSCLESGPRSLAKGPVQRSFSFGPANALMPLQKKFLHEPWRQVQEGLHLAVGHMGLGTPTAAVAIFSALALLSFVASGALLLLHRWRGREARPEGGQMLIGTDSDSDEGCLERGSRGAAVPSGANNYVLVSDASLIR